MRVLYVCTANICRSASAAQLLRSAVAGDSALAGVEVRSAGTFAVPGMPGCGVAPALAGQAEQHTSQLLSRGLVGWADLILPAARDHRAAVVALAPDARARTFTIRQAGRIADWLLESGMVLAAQERAAGAGIDDWAGRFEFGDPRRAVEAMPQDRAARLAWLVGELNAARGMIGVAAEPPSLSAPAPARWWWPGRRRAAAEGRPRRAGSGGGGQPGFGSAGGEDRPGSSLSAHEGSEHRERRSAGTVRPGRPSSGGGGPDLPVRGRGSTANADPLPTSGRAGDPSALHFDDIPDPHVLGMGLHHLAYQQLRSSTDALVRLLREVSPA